MDKERIKGKAEDVAGRVQRQVGEWTGNEKDQAEGLGKAGRRQSSCHYRQGLKTECVT